MSRGRARVASALEEFIDETRLCFHGLKEAAQDLHGQGEISAGRRGVLRSLHQHGPQTVPELARARPVSRQHIQALVNPLAEEGYVELIHNPAHKRSKLVRLTPAGKRLIEAMLRRERRLFEELATEFEVEELKQGADALRHVRRVFADGKGGTRLGRSKK